MDMSVNANMQQANSNTTALNKESSRWVAETPSWSWAAHPTYVGEVRRHTSCKKYPTANATKCSAAAYIRPTNKMCPPTSF